jgi:[ribosomal protein S5]-alanine N-acetyltransferase
MTNDTYILQTERLTLRKFETTNEDAAFILEIYNTAEWIQNIGPRNVHTIQEAKEAIASKYLNSYEKEGFGMNIIQLKETNEIIGMAGLLHRTTLEYSDIGYALLPQYFKQGYATEICKAIIDLAKTVLKIDMLMAIINTDNTASIAVVEKLGFENRGIAKYEPDLPEVYKFYKALH